MKNNLKFKYWHHRITVLSISIICVLFLIIYIFSYSINTTTITKGNIGIFTIGETKEQILQKSKKIQFSPQPKPETCNKNWILVSSMSKIQKKCLLESSTWDVGTIDKKFRCGEYQNTNSTLYFSNNILKKVIIECWLAE